jgi:hypothetical protein
MLSIRLLLQDMEFCVLSYHFDVNVWPLTSDLQVQIVTHSLHIENCMFAICRLYVALYSLPWIFVNNCICSVAMAVSNFAAVCTGGTGGMGDDAMQAPSTCTKGLQPGYCRHST